MPRIYEPFFHIVALSRAFSVQISYESSVDLVWIWTTTRIFIVLFVILKHLYDFEIDLSIAGPDIFDDMPFFVRRRDD